VTLTAAFGDLDSHGGIIFGGATISSAVNITLSAFDDINLPTLSAPGTISATSTNGKITDADGAGTNVTAAKAAFSANTGIGVGDAIETAVSNLEAQSITGGIFVSNTGDLTIGNVNVTLTGVRATTSGDIVLTNAGNVSVTVSGQNVVAQSGNVSITANGATADIVTGGGNSTPLAAIRTVAGGDITLVAGQDVLLGNTQPFWGNVRSFGGVVISAGRDLIVDVDSFLESGTSGGRGRHHRNSRAQYQHSSEHFWWLAHSSRRHGRDQPDDRDERCVHGRQRRFYSRANEWRRHHNYCRQYDD